MIYSIKSSDDKELHKIYKTSMKKLDKFFEINWKFNKPRLFLVKDRETIDLLRNKKTKKWVIGFVINKDLFVLDKKAFKKESSHKYSKKKYEKLIKHEMTHLYFKILSNSKVEPDWLWEGTAMYLEGLENVNKPQKLNNFLEFYSNKEKNALVYKESGWAVKYLIDEYGKSKLLKLIKSLKETNSKQSFSRKFKEIYGFNLEYKNFQIYQDHQP